MLTKAASLVPDWCCHAIDDLFMGILASNSLAQSMFRASFDLDSNSWMWIADFRASLASLGQQLVSTSMHAALHWTRRLFLHLWLAWWRCVPWRKTRTFREARRPGRAQSHWHRSCMPFITDHTDPKGCEVFMQISCQPCLYKPHACVILHLHHVFHYHHCLQCNRTAALFVCMLWLPYLTWWPWTVRPGREMSGWGQVFGHVLCACWKSLTEVCTHFVHSQNFFNQCDLSNLCQITAVLPQGSFSCRVKMLQLWEQDWSPHGRHHAAQTWFPLFCVVKWWSCQELTGWQKIKLMIQD